MPKQSPMVRACGTGIITLACLLLTAAGWSATGDPVPAERDRCAVCGMFVAKFPAWVASIGFSNAGPLFFDGPKDLFTCLFNLRKYAPGRSQSSITAIRVRDYYSLKSIDARTAYFVIGSDVEGPMGKDLVPFAVEKDAREFLKDHKGQRVVRFGDVTAALLRTLH